MGPMLPQGAVLFDQAVQILGLIALPPRPEDHVMGAFDGVDAVDLNKTQTAYQIGQRLARGGARRRLCQGVAVQEQTAGLEVG